MALPRHRARTSRADISVLRTGGLAKQRRDEQRLSEQRKVTLRF